MTRTIATKMTITNIIIIIILSRLPSRRDEEVRIHMGEPSNSDAVVHKLHEGYIYFPEVLEQTVIVVEITVKERSTGRFAIAASSVQSKIKRGREG